MVERKYKKWSELSEKEREDNRKRKRARYAMEKAGKVKRNDGKTVEHKQSLGKGGGNGMSNLKVSSVKENLGRKGEGGRRKGVSHSYPKKRRS